MFFSSQNDIPRKEYIQLLLKTFIYSRNAVYVVDTVIIFYVGRLMFFARTFFFSMRALLFIARNSCRRCRIKKSIKTFSVDVKFAKYFALNLFLDYYSCFIHEYYSISSNSDIKHFRVKFHMLFAMNNENECFFVIYFRWLKNILSSKNLSAFNSTEFHRVIRN